jgi:uncharacterized protein
VAGADKKPDPPRQRARGSASRQLLLVAWAVLIGSLGGAVLWTQLGGPSEPPPSIEAARIALAPAPAMMEEAPAPAVPEAEAKPPEPVQPPAAEPPPPPAAAPAPEAAPPPPVTQQPAPAPAPPAPPPPVAQPAPPPSPPVAAKPPPVQAAVVVPRLPSAREATQPPWLRNSRPFDANDRRPRVAVVISELGLSSAATTASIQQTPAEVTLAFSPYADNLDHWIGLARAAGHEVLINLPMEPINFPANDPGPRALLTNLSAQQNLERLDWVLGRINGHVGVTNHMGSRFTTMPDALKPVLAAINERGLMFVDSRASARSIAAKLASDMGLPRAINDRQIDQEASRPAIDNRLTEIERIARETGSAVAMAQPYPVTLERVNAWLQTLETKGLVLAPITAVANRQADR